MDKRTTGIIATIVTALLCGCPGLTTLCFGVIFAFTGAIPGSDIDVMGSSDPAAAIGFGIGAICLGVIFVAIPIAVGFFMLRKQPGASADVIEYDEPVPPAI